MKKLLFQEGCLSSELSCIAMILLPKVRGGYRGIGLVETIYKMISTIINARLGVSIYLHNDLSGIW